MLTWSADGTAKVWDTFTGESIGTPLTHATAITGAVFNSDETRILTWSEDGIVKLWNMATTNKGKTAKQGHVYGSPETNPKTELLFLSTGKDVLIMDPRVGRSQDINLQYQAIVLGAELSPHKDRILTWGDDHTARLWDAKTGKAVGPALQHQGRVGGAEFSRDGAFILSWSDENIAQIWDVETGQPIGHTFRHRGAPLVGAHFCKDATCIFTLSSDQSIRYWPLRADMDFPVQYFKMRIQAETGTEYDFLAAQFKPLDLDAWLQIRKRYEVIAKEHAKVCQYSNANDWLNK